MSVCLQPDLSTLQLLCKLKHYCPSEVHKHASLIWSLFPVWWQRTESRRRRSPDLMTSAQEERHRNYSAAVTLKLSSADALHRWTGRKSRASRLLKDQQAQAFFIYQQNTERRDSDLTQHRQSFIWRPGDTFLMWGAQQIVWAERLDFRKRSWDEPWWNLNTAIKGLVGRKRWILSLILNLSGTDRSDQVGSAAIPACHILMSWECSVLTGLDSVLKC